MKHLVLVVLLASMLLAGPAHATPIDMPPGNGSDLARGIGGIVTWIWKATHGDVELGPITISFHDGVHMVHPAKSLSRR